MGNMKNRSRKNKLRNVENYIFSTMNTLYCNHKEIPESDPYGMQIDEIRKSTRVGFWEGNVSEKLIIHSTRKQNYYYEVELEKPFQGYSVRTH